MIAHATFLRPRAIEITVGQRWELHERCYAHCVKGDIHEEFFVPRGMLRVTKVLNATLGGSPEDMVHCIHGGMPGWEVWFTAQGLAKCAVPVSDSVPEFMEWHGADVGGEAGGA